MSVLVTGGAGFIGAHVVNDLIAMGEQVVVLDDLSGGFRENVHPEALFIHGSINDVGLVDRIFADHKIEHVFHLAAYAGPRSDHQLALRLDAALELPVDSRGAPEGHHPDEGRARLQQGLRRLGLPRPGGAHRPSRMQPAIRPSSSAE